MSALEDKLDALQEKIMSLKKEIYDLEDEIEEMSFLVPEDGTEYVLEDKRDRLAELENELMKCRDDYAFYITQL